MNYNDYYKKIYASWLGKLIGIRLGAPIENWLGKDVRRMYHPIHNYTVNYGQFAADDDANGPLFFSSVMEKYNLDTITAKAMGEHVLNVVGNHTGFFWWGGKGIATEETAWQNLMDKIPAPESGSIKVNGQAIAEQIGGQIFSDCWGYITLGNVNDAVKLASMMASVTHDGDGIEGAKFVSACIALAWNEKDIYTIITKAKKYLSNTSNYYKLVTEIEDFYHKYPNDSDKCLAYIEDKHSYEHYEGICHILPNTAIMIYGMLYGKNDFDETMRLIAEAGRDTDCNLGNVGSIMGMMLGLEGIDEKWITPFNDILISSSSIGSKNISTISNTAKYFTKLGCKLYNIPFSTNNSYDFSLPYSTNGFTVTTNRYSACSLRTNSNKLQINLDSVLKKQKILLSKTSYFASDEVYDCRYSPQYTPLIEIGDTLRFKFSNPDNLPLKIKLYYLMDNKKKSHLGTYTFNENHELSLLSSSGSQLIRNITFEITAQEDIKQSFITLDYFEVEKNPIIHCDFSKLKKEDWGINFGGTHEEGIRGLDIYQGKVSLKNDSLVLHSNSAFNMSSVEASFKSISYEFEYKKNMNLTLAYDWRGCYEYRGLVLDTIKNELSYIERTSYTKHRKTVITKLPKLSKVVRLEVYLNKNLIVLSTNKKDYEYSFAKLKSTHGAIAFINNSNEDIKLLEIHSRGKRNEKYFD